VAFKIGAGGPEEAVVELPEAGGIRNQADAIVEMVEVSGMLMVKYPLAVRTAMLETREHFAALEQWGMYQKPDYDAYVFTLKGAPEHVNAIKEAMSEERLTGDLTYEQNVSQIRQAIHDADVARMKLRENNGSTPTS
jgi:hypothetical protein